MSNPVILYNGERQTVTADTARELVEAGLAILVEGELPAPSNIAALTALASRDVESLLSSPHIDTVELTPSLDALADTDEVPI